MRITGYKEDFIKIFSLLAAVLAAYVCIYLYLHKHPDYIPATPLEQEAVLIIILCWGIALLLAMTIFGIACWTTTITEEEEYYMLITKENVMHIILPKPRNKQLEEYIIERIIDNDQRMPDAKWAMIFIKTIKEKIRTMFFGLPAGIAFIAPCLTGNPIFTNRQITTCLSIIAFIALSLFTIQLATYWSKLQNEYRVLHLIKEAEQLRGNSPINMTPKETR